MLGNALLDRLIMLINAVTVLGSVGVFYYLVNIYKRPLPNDVIEFETLKQSLQNQTKVSSTIVEKMLINLPSNNIRLRYAEIEMHLLPYLDLHTPILEQNKHLIKDAMIDIVSKMGPQEINTVAGKILLEDRLRKDINKKLEKQVIKRIFFTTFVVQ